ncbi:MAG: hypothetical protein Q9212_004777, partial [Teloschistes hypoglaucus]
GPSTPPPPTAPTTPPFAPSKPSAAPKPAADSTPFVPPTGQPSSSGATHHFGVPRQELPVETSTKVPPQDLLYPTWNITFHGECVNKVLFWAYENPLRWATVLACYFQTGERSPRDVAHQFYSYECGFSGGYRRDWRLLDINKATGVSVTPYWMGPEEVVANNLLQAKDGDRHIIEEVMTRWSRDRANWGMCEAVLRSTFWTTEWPHNAAWKVVDGILKMPEGKEKEEKMALAKKESPLFFAACLKDDLCGMTRETVKRKSEEDHLEDHYEVLQRESGPRRIYHGARLSPKQQKLNAQHEILAMGGGQPTQFHGVPYEERAIDENGNRLPWALEWPEGHPNARGQRRRPVETGPFGKSMRRKGSARASLRATRTATPAKKESSSSAVDGFMRGLQEDKRRAELYGEGIDPSASYAAQKDTITATASKEPVYVSLYGFSSDTQWRAISHYEKVSRGMICETYDRDPPNEARRYPTAFSALENRRPLTTLEKKMSMLYKGGQAWIRVTFDSAAAAERACYYSPHLIQGHWVYAEPYVDGVIPNHDEPIPLKPEEREGDTTSAKPSHIPTHKTTQSLGSAFARNMHTQQGQANSTLPTSFVPNTASQQESPQPLQPESSSPSTASSATATAPSTATGGTNIRQRVFGQWSSQQSASGRPRQGNTGPFMTHFPDLPRIPLRPAHEAFLPQPTRMERTLAWLEQRHLFPGDFIGNGPPRLENGDFDYANASFYWRFFHWIDSTFGTDICALRPE